jgi:hypothetical protein
MPTCVALRRRSDDRHRIDRSRSAPGGLGRCCGDWRAIASITAQRAAYPNSRDRDSQLTAEFHTFRGVARAASPIGAAVRRQLRSLRGPFEQDVERRAHRLSPIGQSVLDLGRHLRVDGAAPRRRAPVPAAAGSASSRTRREWLSPARKSAGCRARRDGRRSPSSSALPEYGTRFRFRSPPCRV